MFPLKQSTAGQKIYVILKDSAGAVVTGVTDPTLTGSKAGGAFGALHDGAWAELGGGVYTIQADDTDSDTVGGFVVRVVKAGCVDAFVHCWVRANTEADNYSRLGAPVGASVSADVAAVKAVNDAIKLKTDNLPAQPAAVGSAMTLTAAYDAAKTAAPAGAKMDLVDAPNAEAVAVIQAGLALDGTVAKINTPMILDPAYDAAKTAAQPGDEMDLVDAPNAEAVGVIQAGLAQDGTVMKAADYVAPDNASIAAAAGSAAAIDERLPEEPASEGNVTAVGLAVAGVDGKVDDLATDLLALAVTVNSLAATTGSIATAVAVIRVLTQGELEFDLENSLAYRFDDAGDPAYVAGLTDKDGADVTADTVGPINMSRWTAL